VAQFLPEAAPVHSVRALRRGRNRDYEHAAALGRDAVHTAQVSSTRTLGRLRTLRRQVRPLRTSSRNLGELDERITDLLTRNRARRDEDSTT
jgi:hypothetical protein